VDSAVRGPGGADPAARALQELAPVDRRGHPAGAHRAGHGHFVRAAPPVSAPGKTLRQTHRGAGAGQARPGPDRGPRIRPKRPARLLCQGPGGVQPLAPDPGGQSALFAALVPPGRPLRLGQIHGRAFGQAQVPANRAQSP